MSKTKQTIPSAFEGAFSSIGLTDPEIEGGVTVIDDNFTTDVDIENKPEPDKKESEDKDEPGKQETVAKEDTTDIPEEVLNQMKSSTDEGDKGDEETMEEDLTDADVTEAQQVSALFDAVAESFGWNLSDISEDDRPVTVEGLTDYLRGVVEENSIPQYADERIQMLDEYVKNGGNFEDFYAAQQQQINYDKIDLEDEVNQKAAIRDLLKLNGYSDDQINNKISRYEDAGLLEDEATEAVSRLKSIKAQQTKAMHEQQEAQRKQQEEQQKAFFNDMNEQLSNLSNIRGLAIPKEDRKALFDYIFKVDSDGLSQYQKDFNKNLTRNLIESAYFTMNADKLIQEAKKEGQTSAAQKLKQMLRHTSKNHSSYNADEDKPRPAWEIASKFL